MKKALIITACVFALLLGVAYNFWQDGTNPNLGIIPFVLFGVALLVGFTRRLIKARRAGNLREGFEPLRDAGLAFENLAFGRDPQSRPGHIQNVGQPLPKDPMD